MPGNQSRDKGQRRELEAAQILGARKISRMRQAGPDLQYGERFVEVKARANGFKQLYGWLQDDAQILMLKADRAGWLICMPVEVFMDLQEEAAEIGPEGGMRYG